MKPTYETVIASFDHALEIATDPRVSDVEEVLAARGYSILRAMYDGLRLSDRSYTVLADGVPLCMIGIAPKSQVYRVGVPWMLSSNKLVHHERAILRYSKDFFYPMAMHYAELENYVDARNEASIRWLRWLGFDFDPAAPYGVAGLPFHRFYMKA